MPTARLVDINTAAITYRTKCLMALDKRKYRNCIGAIIAMNSLLPEDDDEHQYRIRIDSYEYAKLTTQNSVIICNNCKNEIQYNSVKFYEVNVDDDERFLTDEQTEEIWFCPKCNEENKRKKSDIIESVQQKPSYGRIVPDPPVNNHGILSNLSFHHEMEEWVWLCIGCLEDGFSKFRDDNWNKGDPYNQNYEVDTSLDDLDAS